LAAPVGQIGSVRAVTTPLEAGELAVGMIIPGGRTTVKRCDGPLRRRLQLCHRGVWLLQAARRALRPRPDGALSGGIDFRDASDHGASADTRTPCMAPSRRQRLVSVILVASARLNSRKNKDKSERLVTCFVRVPGMYEAGPRYHAAKRKKALGPTGSRSGTARPFPL
jgi:hypothetical protein